MIRDEELRQVVDYSEGQKTAAYMILGEIVNLLGNLSDNIRLIGGWVPSLLYPESDHIGSIDVDILLNQLQIRKAESYKTIRRLLEQILVLMELWIVDMSMLFLLCHIL